MLTPEGIEFYIDADGKLIYAPTIEARRTALDAELDFTSEKLTEKIKVAENLLKKIGDTEVKLTKDQDKIVKELEGFCSTAQKTLPKEEFEQLLNILDEIKKTISEYKKADRKLLELEDKGFKSGFLTIKEQNALSANRTTLFVDKEKKLFL